MTQKTKQGQKPEVRQVEARQRGNWSAQHRPKTKAKVTLPTVTLQQQKDKAQ